MRLFFWAPKTYYVLGAQKNCLKDVLGAQKNCLMEMVLLSTHNICFGWEMKK